MATFHWLPSQSIDGMQIVPAAMSHPGTYRLMNVRQRTKNRFLGLHSSLHSESSCSIPEVTRFSDIDSDSAGATAESIADYASRARQFLIAAPRR